MYVGNLESYQGIDLMIESFERAIAQAPTAHLVVIGGKAEDVDSYTTQVKQHGTENNIHFVGPRPIGNLKQYLAQADIVVSPRTQGENTPMKLYSYLDSGKALIATNLMTHTQVCTDKIAWLAEPTTEDFAHGIVQLVNNPELRTTLATAAQAYIAQEHTFNVFSQKLSSLYDWLEGELTPQD